MNQAALIAVLVTGGLFVGISIGYWFRWAEDTGLLIRNTPTDERAQFSRSVRGAAREMDEAFTEAETTMEEAAGLRSPGESRIGDKLGSQWEW